MRSEREMLVVTRPQRALWTVFTLLYTSCISVNLFAQHQEDWKKYPFELTQIGAWMTLIQHLIHPHSPIKPLSVKPILLAPKRGPRRNSSPPKIYTASEGFSNLALTTEAMIPALYWGLAYQFIEVNSTKSYVNTSLMHGTISASILLDYLINQRPYHFLPSLLNIFILMGLYGLWNFIGQKVIGESVYPMMDWEARPLNILYTAALGCGSALVMAGLLKGMTSVREKLCPARPPARSATVVHDSYVRPQLEQLLLAEAGETKKTEQISKECELSGTPTNVAPRHLKPAHVKAKVVSTDASLDFV